MVSSGVESQPTGENLLPVLGNPYERSSLMSLIGHKMPCHFTSVKGSSLAAIGNQRSNIAQDLTATTLLILKTGKLDIRLITNIAAIKFSDSSV